MNAQLTLSQQEGGTRGDPPPLARRGGPKPGCSALCVPGDGCYCMTWPLPHAESRHFLSGTSGPMVFKPRMRPTCPACILRTTSRSMHDNARRAGRLASFSVPSGRPSSLCIRAKQQSSTLRYLPSRCLLFQSKLQGEALANGRHEMRPAWLVARFQLPALPPSAGQNGCGHDLFDRSKCEQSMLSCHPSMPSSCSQV